MVSPIPLAHLVALHELSVALAGAVGVRDVLQIVSRVTKDQLSLEGATAIAWAPDGTYLCGAGSVVEPVAVTKTYDGLKSFLQMHMGGGDLLPVEELPPAARLEVEGGGGALVIGLTVNDQVVGALALGGRSAGERISDRDLGILKVIAAQGASAIDGTIRLQSLQSRVAQTEKLASLGIMLAGVAHEINNPVAFIAGNAEVLRELTHRLRDIAARHPEVAIGPVVRDLSEAVDLVSSGADRTATIVRDLRSFARTGDAASPTAIDVHDALDVSLRLLHSRIGRNVVIHREFGILPMVESIGVQIGQVFMNILANACDAVGERGNIWVTTTTEGHEVTVRVRDDGPGIAREELERVFEPFFTTKPDGKGTGLGLPIARDMITAHGGTLEVRSAPGVGTTVTIVVPDRQHQR